MLGAIRALISGVNAPSSLRLWARWMTLSPRNAALTGIQIETQQTLGIGTLDGPLNSSEVAIHRLSFCFFIGVLSVLVWPSMKLGTRGPLLLKQRE